MPRGVLCFARCGIIALASVAFACGALGFASARAETAAPPAFNTLRTPTSPAFTLLGVAPASVERPNSPADFALSILNHSGDLTSLPKDFALEVAPYWLRSHASLRWEADTTRGVSASLARTFTLSAASAETGTNDRPATSLSVGFRTSIWSGHISRASVAGLNEIAQGLANSVKRALESTAAADSARNELLLAALASAKTQEDIERAKRIDEQLVAAIGASAAQKEEAEKEQTKASARFQGLATQREGFWLELAGAAAWRAGNAVADSAKLDRWGLWLTASDVTSPVNYTFLGRYSARPSDKKQDTFDAGVRVTYPGDTYAVSLEYVDRRFVQDSGRTPQWRFAGVFDYQLHNDLWVVGTFGRDFQDTAHGSLLAQLGLTYNLSKDRAELP